MPWDKPEQATKHTHLANTPARQRQWLHVANSMMQRGSTDVEAIEAANGVLRDHPSMKKEETRGTSSESKSAQQPVSVTARKPVLGMGMKPHNPPKKKR